MSAQNLDEELSKLRIDKTRKPAHRGGYAKLLVALLLGAGGLAYVYYARAQAPIAVRVAKAEVESGGADVGAAVLTAGGYIVPRKKIEVSSKIIGRVKEVLVERGDPVQAGDVLLRLEDEEQAAQVAAAEAQLAAAKARLTELQAGSRPEEIAAARAAVASAEATLKKARADLDRFESLAREEVISQQELDTARTAHDVALANLDSARKNAELVEKGPRQEQIDTALAQTREAEANLAYAKTQLDDTVIRAPITGTILEKVAEKGELVTNINFGGTRGAKSSVVSMADLRDLQVEVDLNENDLHKVRLGQLCEVRPDSAPDVVVKGEVDQIAPQADRQKATVQVKARLIDPDGRVRPEVNARVMFLADASLQAGAAPAAQAKIWAPRAALVKSADGTIVYLASQGAAVARKVALGAESEKGVEVTEGLDGTEALIVEPLDRMADGARIVVK